MVVYIKTHGNVLYAKENGEHVNGVNILTFAIFTHMYVAP